MGSPTENGRKTIFSASGDIARASGSPLSSRSSAGRPSTSAEGSFGIYRSPRGGGYGLGSPRPVLTTSHQSQVPSPGRKSSPARLAPGELAYPGGMVPGELSGGYSGILSPQQSASFVSLESIDAISEPDPGEAVARASRVLATSMSQRGQHAQQARASTSLASYLSEMSLKHMRHGAIDHTGKTVGVWKTKKKRKQKQNQGMSPASLSSPSSVDMFSATLPMGSPGARRERLIRKVEDVMTFVVAGEAALEERRAFAEANRYFEEAAAMLLPLREQITHEPLRTLHGRTLRGLAVCLRASGKEARGVKVLEMAQSILAESKSINSLQLRDKIPLGLEYRQSCGKLGPGNGRDSLRDSPWQNHYGCSEVHDSAGEGSSTPHTMTDDSAKEGSSAGRTPLALSRDHSVLELDAMKGEGKSEGRAGHAGTDLVT